MIRSPKMPEGVRVQGRSRTRPILPPTPETWRNPSRKRMRRLLSQSAPKMYDSPPGPPLLFLTLSLSLSLLRFSFSCGNSLVVSYHFNVEFYLFVCLFVCFSGLLFSFGLFRFPSLPPNTHTHTKLDYGLFANIHHCVCAQ